jgi:hypothetical protein
MTRNELVKRLADEATRPLSDFLHEADPQEASADPSLDARDSAADLFVWFEDTAIRQREGRRGIAGLPESLLPVARSQRVIERRFVPGHFHLLSAVRIRCAEKFGERIAAIYTAALSVGTVAWIGTGQQYEQAWRDSAAEAADGDLTP